MPQGPIYDVGLRVWQQMLGDAGAEYGRRDQALRDAGTIAAASEQTARFSLGLNDALTRSQELKTVVNGQERWASPEEQEDYFRKESDRLFGQLDELPDADPETRERYRASLRSEMGRAYGRFKANEQQRRIQNIKDSLDFGWQAALRSGNKAQANELVATGVHGDVISEAKGREMLAQFDVTSAIVQSQIDARLHPQESLREHARLIELAKDKKGTEEELTQDQVEGIDRIQDIAESTISTATRKRNSVYLQGGFDAYKQWVAGDMTVDKLDAMLQADVIDPDDHKSITALMKRVDDPPLDVGVYAEASDIVEKVQLYQMDKNEGQKQLLALANKLPGAKATQLLDDMRQVGVTYAFRMRADAKSSLQGMLMARDLMEIYSPEFKARQQQMFDTAKIELDEVEQQRAAAGKPLTATEYLTTAMEIGARKWFEMYPAVTTGSPQKTFPKPPKIMDGVPPGLEGIWGELTEEERRSAEGYILKGYAPDFLVNYFREAQKNE